MKIRTIEMFRRESNYDWEAKDLADGERLFLCKNEWKRLFPSLNRRKKITMTVYTHAVPASQKFQIFRPFRHVNFNKGIDGINDMYPSVKLIIDEILDHCKKEKMPVWVTVE